MNDWRMTAQALTGLNRELLASGGEKIKAAGETAVSGVKKAGSTLTRRRKKQNLLEDGET